MHADKSSILLFILFVIVGADAVTVFRGGNASGPVNKIRADDFDVVDGQVVPNAQKGLSCFTTLAAAQAIVKAKDFYSIDSDAITAAGFGFLADGSDVGGPRAKGHRSITVKTPVSEAALQQGLNNINESPGPGILQWTKLPRTAAPAAKPAAPAAAKPPAAPAAKPAAPAAAKPPAAPAAKPAAPAATKPLATPAAKPAALAAAKPPPAPVVKNTVAKTKNTVVRSRVFRGVEVEVAV